MGLTSLLQRISFSFFIVILAGLINVRSIHVESHITFYGDDGTLEDELGKVFEEDKLTLKAGFLKLTRFRFIDFSYTFQSVSVSLLLSLCLISFPALRTLQIEEDTLPLLPTHTLEPNNGLPLCASSLSFRTILESFHAYVLEKLISAGEPIDFGTEILYTGYSSYCICPIHDFFGRFLQGQPRGLTLYPSRRSRNRNQFVDM